MRSSTQFDGAEDLSWIQEKRRTKAFAWAKVVKDLVNDRAITSMTWTDRRSIRDVLTVFVAQPNLAFWTPDGYRNLIGVRLAAEPDCIELTSTVEWPSIVRPKRLALQIIETARSQSFLMLELDELQPCSPKPSHGRQRELGYEELFETTPGSYLNLSEYDGLKLGDDLNNRRVVTRWFQGQILIISPSSILNMGSRSEDGCLVRLPSFEVRALIEGALALILQNHQSASN